MEFRVKVNAPRIPAGLTANLVGLLGLIAVAVTVGGFLASLGFVGAWWVAGFIAACEMVYLGAANGPAEDEAPAEPAVEPTPIRKPAAVKAA